MMRTRWQWIAVLMGSSLMGFGCLQANGAPDKQPAPGPASKEEPPKTDRGCDSPFAIAELESAQMPCIRASDLPAQLEAGPAPANVAVGSERNARVGRWRQAGRRGGQAG